MTVLLHEGHEHTETAAAAMSGANADLTVAAVVGALLLIPLLGYAITRYRD
ncbi:hypothetical protein [Halobellus salinisoli]|uniref:hypothetical protein n=1 Tax=Halobellus salinisoli TaxID=3108500 RepID=UPI00300BCDF1